MSEPVMAIVPASGAPVVVAAAATVQVPAVFTPAALVMLTAAIARGVRVFEVERGWGGDLELFIRCREEQDRPALLAYALSCRALLRTVLAAEGETTAIIRGCAYGGHFEAALACDHIVLHPGARLGFPEVLYGFWPFAGGPALLAAKAGYALARDAMTTGRTYEAPDLPGLVEQPGTGGAPGLEWLRPPLAAGDREVEAWVDRVMEHADLRAMRLMVRARLRAAAAAVEAAAAVPVIPLVTAAPIVPVVVAAPSAPDPERYGGVHVGLLSVDSKPLDGP